MFIEADVDQKPFGAKRNAAFRFAPKVIWNATGSINIWPLGGQATSLNSYSSIVTRSIFTSDVGLSLRSVSLVAIASTTSRPSFTRPKMV